MPGRFFMSRFFGIPDLPLRRALSYEGENATGRAGAAVIKVSFSGGFLTHAALA
jgi:hypothetical protein